MNLNLADTFDESMDFWGRLKWQNRTGETAPSGSGGGATAVAAAGSLVL
jgi:hypothetical protein